MGLERNSFTGAIPVRFLQLERLRLLHFADNEGLCLSGSGESLEWLTQLDVYDGPLCDGDDRETLTALYETTGGTDWIRADGWLGDGPLDDWQGVRTDSLGRVRTLDLSNNGVTGHAPVSLGLLTSMTSLRIDGNAGLAGSIPLALSALPLEVLHYHGTELCIPPDQQFGEWLAAIPSHESTGIECPPLSDRDILELLYGATAGPDWTHSDNWLSDRPLGEWSGVTTDDDGRVVRLGLTRNNLSGPIPPELADLGELSGLTLADNRLKGPIPPRLGDLSNLAVLRFEWNELTGSIPPELGGLSSLSELALSGNGLTGPIPSELGGLPGLTTLDLSWNDLTGPIPTELGDLTSLRLLYLTANHLTGPIPPELSTYLPE